MSDTACTLRPGDLCQYMSRIVLILSDPYFRDWDCGPYGDAGTANSSEWIEAIEIDDNTFRKIDCEHLTLIQRAKEE